MVVVVKTMQIKTPERLTRSVKYILNPKKTNVPYVETEKDFPVTFTEDKKMMQLVSGHQISNVNYADQEFFLTKIMANANIKPIRVSKKMLEIEKMILSKIKRSRGSHCRQNLNQESACRFVNVATFKSCRLILFLVIDRRA